MFVRIAFCVALLSAPLHLPAAVPGGKAGLDVTLEGSVALAGSACGSEALHHYALGWIDWTRADQPATRAWPVHLYASALALAGTGPTERYLGDFLGASNTEGHASIRLYSWWLETGHADWSLRAGALLADEEFAGTEAGGNFFNSAFGWPVFISANTVNTGPAFYVSAPGLRWACTPNDHTTWRIGVYDGDSYDSPAGDPRATEHGLHYATGGDQGFLVMSELAFAPGKGLTRVKLGAWVHTAKCPHMRDDAHGHAFAVSGEYPAEFRQNFGFYALMERTLAGEKGAPGNVEFFARCGLSPADRNPVDFALDAGMAWTGPIPGRGTDVLAVGIAHAHFSGAFAEHCRLTDPTAASMDFEQVIEASYTLILSEKFNLQPDLQFIRHPGGRAGQRDALVALLRFNASF